ncbi:MAG: divergent PAP2 family protein [Lachnospiraceae bacterium]|nr:divergent PAP2 family protein [Lachnospiraceae bacterium]
MWKVINQILTNQVLISATIGWCGAEVAKLITNAVVTKKFDIKRLFGDGGMPSAHSSTVCSLAVATAFVCGIDSPIFALSTFFAFITMHDAMGVRQETGKQAQLLNKILEVSDITELLSEKKLKELVGHTPLQVFFGGVLGILIGLAVNFLIFNPVG